MVSRSSLWPLIILALALFAGIGSADWGRGDRSVTPSRSILTTLDPDAVKFLAPGQEGLVASLRWVTTVFDYADNVFEGQTLDRVLRGVRFVKVVDPRWETPYEFGGLVFDDPRCEDCMIFAEELLAEASVRFPNWRYKVYYGMFLLKRRRDTAAAVRVLEPLTRVVGPGIPTYVRGLASSIQTEQQGVFQAVRRMESIRWSELDGRTSSTFFLMQSMSLLERESGLPLSDVRLLTPLLEVIFRSEDSTNRTQARNLLGSVLEQTGQAREDILTPLRRLSVTAPGSGSSKSP